MISKGKLIAFEDRISKRFLYREILAPIHLSKGNETALIKIFKLIGKDDWVFSTHRSHYHALLKGIPEDWVEKEIIEGRSIHLFNEKYKFFSSAIVAGICPIALGVAKSIALKVGTEKVWCFVGDMAAETGSFYECSKYASRNNLPITFIVEDNGLSTNSPTQEVWGLYEHTRRNIIRYQYKRGYPHVGCG